MKVILIIGTIFAATLKTKSLVLFFSIVILFLGIYLLLIKEKEQNTISEIKLYLTPVNPPRVNTGESTSS